MLCLISNKCLLRKRRRSIFYFAIFLSIIIISCIDSAVGFPTQKQERKVPPILLSSSCPHFLGAQSSSSSLFASTSKTTTSSSSTESSSSSSAKKSSSNKNGFDSINERPQKKQEEEEEETSLSSQKQPNSKISSRFQTRFEEMQERNKKGETLTQEYCDSILGLCVASDEWESVLEVLDVMKNQNLSQERSSYQACLQSCFEMGNGSSAKEILQAMNQALVTPRPTDIALVVAAMCRNDIKDPSGLWWKQSLSLLRDSRSSNLDGDENDSSSSTNTRTSTTKNEPFIVPVEAYDTVINRLVEGRKWKEAVRLLREMQEGSKSKKNPTHPEPVLSTYREVVECCVAANQAEQSVQVLQSMVKEGIKPTVYTFELVISALAKKSQWRRSLRLLDLMDELEVPKTIITYNTVISACSRAREVGMAKNLLASMRKRGIKPNIITFNSLISACASTSRWKDALSLLSECAREPGVSPDIYSYTNAIRACAKGGQTQRALTLLQVVKDLELPVDTYCYTAAIEACAKARKWKKALDLLDEMEKMNIEPSEVTYSVTISACGNGGKWGKALDLLDLMKQKGMRINLITYNAAITALSKAAKQRSRYQQNSSKKNDSGNKDEQPQLWKRALGLIDQMKEDGLSPDGFSFSAAISCCGAEGRWKEALDLIELMQKGGPRTRPNRIAYTAAISACGRSGEYEHALRLFRNMKDQGLSADRVAYNALFSALRVSQKTDIAYELWGEMCGKSPSSTNHKRTEKTKFATAKSDAKTTPDIITVTDVIAVLSRSESKEDYIHRVDNVFAEAVKRGIVLDSNLDSSSEIDLSGLSLPVARAACRYIMKEKSTSDDLSFITGVGKSHNKRFDDGNTSQLGDISLRDYVKEVLLKDFHPPIESFVPGRAPGIVQVNKESLENWLREQ